MIVAYQNRNRKLASWLVLCISLASLRLDADTIFLDRAAGGIVKRAIVIPEDEFTLSNIENLTRRFLRENEGKFRVLMFYVFVHKDHAGHYLSGLGFTDVTYEGWLQVYNSYGKVPYPIAEVLAIGSSATLRYRDRNGKIGRIVLQGEDTFHYRLNGMDFQVVSVGSGDIPDVFKDGPHDPMSVGFAIKTSAPLTEEIGKAILKLLAQKTGTHDIGVGLRRDIWFIEDGGGPSVSPFFESGVPPTKDQYYGSITLSCGLSANKLHCTKFGGFKTR